MKIKNIYLSILISKISLLVYSQEIIVDKYSIYSFGVGGNLKMLYDRRQRPQALEEGNKVYIVYNGNSINKDEKPKTFPVITMFDLKTKTFINPFNLDSISSTDHHGCPIIWLDDKMKFHVLYGAHNSPGIHLESKKKLSIGSSVNDWKKIPFLETKVSYPSVSKSAHGDLIYFRNGGHTSHWKYALKKKSKNWRAIDTPTTDLDIKGMFEWSSYHSYILSEDKNYMHIAFVSYDDNKENNPGRYFNERYNQIVTNDFKYNLYYLKIDIRKGKAFNFSGKELLLPIDLFSANKNCLIWNTEGRASGAPPQIILDKNGNPAFLHVITEKTINDFNYYFVQFIKQKWIKSPIRSSNHQWNNGEIIIKNNKIFSYLIVGDKAVRTPFDDAMNFLNKELNNWTKINEFCGGYMDKHGGGQIEEWISNDGIDWEFSKKIIPNNTDSNWKFNNIQFITDKYGNKNKDAFIFYGWNSTDNRKTSAFIYLDKDY